MIKINGTSPRNKEFSGKERKVVRILEKEILETDRKIKHPNKDREREKKERNKNRLKKMETYIPRLDKKKE